MHKRNKTLYNTISSSIFLGVAALIYILINNENYTYRLLWLLPLMYVIATAMYLFIIKRINYKYGIVFFIANLVVFIRYVITPFTIVFSGLYNGIGFGINPTSHNVNTAIVLMVLELVTVYFFSCFVLIHYKRRQIIEMKQTNTNFILMKNKTIIMIFLILSLPVLVLLDPSFLLPKTLESFNEFAAIVPQIPFVGVFMLLVPAVRLSLLLIILSSIKNVYDNTKKHNILISIAWFIVFIYLTILLSTSRWTLVFSAIACLSLMSKLFPKTPKLYYIIICGLTIFSFIVVSTHKFSWAIQSSTNPIFDILRVLASQFQEYFSGPRVVAQSIEMVENYGHKFGIVTLFNDFIGSVPYVSKFIDQTDRINVYFNNYLSIGNVSQIIPMIGNGYAYFPYFPMIFSVIAHVFMIKFDYLTTVERNLEFYYIYVFTGLFFAMSMGFNVQIIFGNFLSSLLVPLMIFSINKKFGLLMQH